MIRTNPETLQPEKVSVRTVKGVQVEFVFPAKAVSASLYIDNCARNAESCLESGFDLACQAYCDELKRAAEARLFPSGGVSKALKEFMESY